MAAQSEQTRRTKLFERWSAAGRGASPFGIILRSESWPPAAGPFQSWEYHPETMPDLVLQIAESAGLEDPMWCYTARGHAPAEASLERRQPLEHPAPLREVTGVHIVCPPLAATSVTRKMADQEVITLEIARLHGSSSADARTWHWCQHRNFQRSQPVLLRPLAIQDPSRVMYLQERW
jgi:hypothetical protein